MTTDELPDFNTARAWLSYNDESYGDWSLPDTISPEELGPWTPLDTAEGHVKRIDRDKLAEVIWQAEDNHVGAYGSTLLDFTVDAVIAAPPELMGGGER